MAGNMEAATDMAAIAADIIKMIQAMLATEKEKVDDPRTEAIKRCAELLQNGDPGCYKLFSNEDAAQVEEMLVKAKVPYLPVANGTRTVLVIPEKYENEFLKVQEMFRYADASIYKDIDERTLIDSVKDCYDRVPRLQYDSIEAASLAAEKLYACDITCSMEKNDDGTYDILVHPQSMYKSGPGSDFTRFEALMAYEQSKNSEVIGAGDKWVNTRLEQALYDEGRMDEFANRAAAGENIVLSDLAPDKESTFYLEARNKVITANYKDSDGSWKKQTLKNSETLNPDEIKKLCSKYTEEIHDMGVIKAAEYNEHYKGKIPDKDYRTPENVRPVFMNTKLEKFGSEEVKPLLERLSNEAGRAARSNGFGNVKRTDLKQVSAALTFERKYIIEKLRNPQDKEIREFINSNKPPLSATQKEAWLLDIAKQLEGTGRHSELSAALSTVSIKEASSKAAKRYKSKEVELQNEKEADLI